MSALTDWLQAIGSIGQAIGTSAAVWYALRIANRQRDDAANDRKEENRLRARALALTIRAAVEDWLNDMQAFEDSVRDGGDTRMVAIVDAFYRSHLFDVPDVLTGNVTRIHLLGAAGDELLSAIAAAGYARPSVQLMHEQLMESDHSASAKEIVDRIWDNYRALEDHLKIALHNLHGIIDEHVRKTRRE